MSHSKSIDKRKVPVIEVDESQLRSHVSEVVRQSVEETLNGLLEAEADALCQARRYERSTGRASTRAGHYERSLQTQAGTVTLRMPKLRSIPFDTAIIERYRRRESSVEEALVEMYLAGVSVTRRRYRSFSYRTCRLPKLARETLCGTRKIGHVMHEFGLLGATE